MKVEDIVRVLGRGYVVVTTPETEIHVGDIITIDGTEFTVRGVEGMRHIKSVGLVLAPNTEVGNKKVGDEIN